MSEGLGPRLRPCGPVRDAEAAGRSHERLVEAINDRDWWKTLDGAWLALEPVFAASPYLAGLARRWPERLRQILETAPETRLDEILAATDAIDGPADEAKAPLRWLKAELHLLTALADLGGG